VRCASRTGVFDIFDDKGHHDLMTSRARRGAAPLSVAETKRRFSELIDRVQRGEHIVVARRGKPVLTLGPPGTEPRRREAPAGLASVVGALSDFPQLDAVVDEIYAARRRARDRKPPDLR